MIVFNFLKGNFPIYELSQIKNLDLQKKKFKELMKSIPTELTCQYCGNKINLDQEMCSFCGFEYDSLLDFSNWKKDI